MARIDCPCVVEAALSLTAATLLVRFVSIRRWRASVLPQAEGAAELSCEQHATARQVGRIVVRTADWIPFRAVCLPQAIAARWMLARRGISTKIIFGTRPARGRTAKPLELHAWLMVGETCVVGAAQRHTFVEFRAAR